MATIDDEIRAWIRAQLDAEGWTQADLVRRTGLNKGTVSAYLDKKIRQLGSDKLQKIELALGRTFVRGQNDTPGVYSPDTAEPPDRAIIPIVRQTRVPPAVGGESMAGRIRRHAHLWRISTGEDPEAFGLELDDPAFEFRARDQIIFSPSTPPKAGNFVCVLDRENRYQVAQYVEDGPTPLVRLPGDDYARGLTVLGVAVDLWRSLLK